MTIVARFAADHRRCDASFTFAEEAAQTGDLPACKSYWATFCTAMAHHFHTEETALFPAFEQASGQTMGPTRVMRMEHAQICESFTALNDALAEGDLDAFLGQAEMLMILMQQHNIKEEQMLYPMCDRALSPDVVSDIQAVLASSELA